MSQAETGCGRRREVLREHPFLYGYSKLYAHICTDIVNFMHI